MSVHKKVTAKRVTVSTLRAMKEAGEKIAMLTAYDYSMARILDEGGADVLLVGDSASNVMAGHETTLPITLDQMIYHASSVVRAAKRALVIVDLPFGTYQGDSKMALKSAIRIMKESGGHAVKLEGGAEVADSIKRILKAGIPVMGHLGANPPIHLQIRHLHRAGQTGSRSQETGQRRQTPGRTGLLRDGTGKNTGGPGQKGKPSHRHPHDRDRWRRGL